ncbi:MAG TPA: hypothetical protein VGS41_00360, partial [Chthonomonadales bacterium]|nr:hypothetical protein [Chthonomonadales bacterium]
CRLMDKIAAFAAVFVVAARVSAGQAGPIRTRISGIGRSPGQAYASPSVRLRYADAGSTKQYALAQFINYGNLKVTVTDSYGNPIAGADVYVYVSGDNSAAGHTGPHTPSAIHGWLAPTIQQAIDDNGVSLDPAQSSIVAFKALGGSQYDGGSQNASYLGPLYTDVNGQATFTYIAPEVAGTDTLTALVFTYLGSTSATLRINVQVSGLLSLLTSTGIAFSSYGVTNTHPQNWYASQSTLNGLTSVWQDYQAAQLSDNQLTTDISNLKNMGYDFPHQIPHGSYNGGLIVEHDPEILFINDISLPLGGMFDVGNSNDGDWASPHGGHRDGHQVDLKSNHLVTGKAYAASHGLIVSRAAPSTAVGDYRIELGIGPFAGYSASQRSQMDGWVKDVQWRRLMHLLDALQNAGCTFADEGAPYHIHAAFP